jgi:hypothetical protein
MQNSLLSMLYLYERDYIQNIGELPCAGNGSTKYDNEMQESLSGYNLAVLVPAHALRMCS